MPVAILGPAGAVGQSLGSLLAGHAWFRLAALGASERSVGRPYEEAARWFLPEPMPSFARGMDILPCRPGFDARVAFSGLDASVAGPIEQEFARAGCAVVSNSRNHRMDPEVPLLIPEVNAEHLELIEAQKRQSGGGFIVTNPNCSTIGLALSAAPLHRAFGIERLVVTTLQAISGAGYSGVASLDILDNVIPHIDGEEEKMQSETLKILGSANRPASFGVSAQCHRVQVSDGHTLAVSVQTAQRTTPGEATRVLREFRASLGSLGLPSLPEQPIDVRDEADRPQPRLDRMSGRGMTGTVRPV